MKMIMVAAALAVAAPGAALAQNADLRASYGDLSLSSGFMPDPQIVEVTAGGPIEANALGGGCSGSVSNAPSVQVTYRAGTLPLVFRTRSDTDTTLAVRDPNGRWVCDDDSWIDGDEEVTFGKPASGAYDVWVGTFAGGTAAAELLVTETPEASAPAPVVPATVDIRTCNESGRSATVAVSYVEVGTGQFVNRGWYDVANGACVDMVSTDNANFYMYADATDGSGRSWSGNHSLCVEYPGPYTFRTTGATYCEAHQEVRDFVPMTASETGSYTWTLNP